jgi:hypothetical protein
MDNFLNDLFLTYFRKKLQFLCDCHCKTNLHVLKIEPSCFSIAGMLISTTT